MRPGADSVAGFLGATESLERVLEEDAATLAELQVSANALADRLNVLLDAYTWAYEQEAYGDEPLMARVLDLSGATIGERELPRQARPTDEEIELGPDEGVLVAGRFQVERVFSAGVQPCPWSEVVPPIVTVAPEMDEERTREAMGLLLVDRVQEAVDGGGDSADRGGGPPAACHAYPDESGSGDWRITNRRTGQELDGPDLIVHLIGAHGFFEGHGTSYRVDPRELTALLELGTFAPSRA